MTIKSFESNIEKFLVEDTSYGNSSFDPTICSLACSDENAENA
jgi:hypothetical protein